MNSLKARRGSLLYSILFSGTAIIVGVMLIIDRNLQTNTFKTSLLSSADSSYAGSGDDINNLLLSGNEFTIEEKTSLINLYLKTGEPVATMQSSTINEKREELYSAILKRQINRNKSNESGDFSVRPIPR
jgi:hypothetical protein